MKKASDFQSQFQDLKSSHKQNSPRINSTKIDQFEFVIRFSALFFWSIFIQMTSIVLLSVWNSANMEWISYQRRHQMPMGTFAAAFYCHWEFFRNVFYVSVFFSFSVSWASTNKDPKYTKCLLHKKYFNFVMFVGSFQSFRTSKKSAGEIKLLTEVK